MKYKVGDRILIKSLDWYNENKDNYGAIYAGNGFCFWKNMVKHCGEIMKITTVKVDPEDSNKGYYFMENSEERWTDEMIEGPAEKEIKPKFKKGDCVKCSDGSLAIIVTFEWSESLNCYQYFVDYIGTLDAGYQPENDLQLHSVTIMNGKDIFEGVKWKHEFECPDGYEFRDENGNVINATKIVLEKKPKYPKTYEECCSVLGYSGNYNMILTTDVDNKLFNALYKLKVCRDAYWKIAGEEMGLGKPWEPDYTEKTIKYCLRTNYCRIVQTRTSHDNHPFSFPTEEMRDAFKENFDPDIEICKELL